MIGTCDVSGDVPIVVLVLGLEPASSVLLLGTVAFNGAEEVVVVVVVFLRFGG
jgi:hypothetical protein